MNFYLKHNWWKYLSVGLLIYTIIGGLLLPVPQLGIINETIRNVYFHVPMWFTMTFLMVVSLWYSIKYLRTFDRRYDIMAAESANVGLWFGVLGLLTGMVWAHYAWGKAWSNDPRQTTAAMFMLIYLAYFVLRGAIEEEDKRAKVSGVYNIFAFFAYVPLTYIIPRLVDSLHPAGGGDSPVFNRDDMDAGMRMVFYPAAIGWIFFGMWIMSLRARFKLLRMKRLEM